MANKSGAVIGFVVVAAIGIAAIALFSLNRAPAPAEDVTGAIGAAERYRAEQLSDEDVQLAGESAGDAAAHHAAFDVTGEELAELLGKASVQEKASFLGRASVAEKGAVLDRATTAEKAFVLDRATAAEKGAMLDRATAAEKGGSA